MLYFSYGSNMSLVRLLERVSSARYFATATLAEHDLRFHKKSKDGSGKCDAYETGNPDHQVVGVVFEIDEVEKPTLDRKEGLGHGYDEKAVVLTTNEGDEVLASTYYATSIDQSLSPYNWYKHHVVTGAKEHGLPEAYLEGINNTDSIVDPKPERHEREMAIYANA